MNPQRGTNGYSHPDATRLRTWRSTLVLFLAAFAPSAMAQSVLTPAPPAYSGQTVLAPSTGPGQLEPAGNDVLNVPESAGQALLSWGAAHVHPHLLYRFLYGDGFQFRPGSQAKTAVNELYPGFTLLLGPHWTLDYTPAFRFYSSSEFRDTLEHAVSLSGTTTYQNWTFGLSQSYSFLSQPLVETGAQTDQDIFLTSLHANYIINSKLSLDLGLSQNLRYVGEDPASELTDSKDWSTSDWINYHLSPKLSFGLGFTFGYTDMSLGSDMTYEQLNARVIWEVVDKLNLIGSVGVENRQFIDSDAPDAVNPLFSISAQYRLFEPTLLSMTASRGVAPSYFANEITETTLVSASLQQRLFKKLFLNLSGGYRLTAYESTSAALAANREDSGTFFSASLGIAVLKRGNVSVFYQTSHNDSNEDGFLYTSNQVGFEIGYRY